MWNELLWGAWKSQISHVVKVAILGYVWAIIIQWLEHTTHLPEEDMIECYVWKALYLVSKSCPLCYTAQHTSIKLPAEHWSLWQTSYC